MNERFLELLKKIRIEARNKKLTKFTFKEIHEKTGISKDQLLEFITNEEELVLKVAGSIVWSREFSWKKKKIVALGFRFKDMSPKFKGMFFMMADSMCYDGVKRR